MTGPTRAGPPSLARALGWLQSAERAVAVTAVLGAALALIADLFGRELFGTGIFGAQRAAVHLTFVAGMLGFALATGAGAHLRIRASDALLPPGWTPATERLGSLASAAILLLLAYYAGRFVWDTWRVGERSVTLGIPLWPVQSLMVYAFTSAALRNLIYAIRPSLKPEPAAQR